MAPMPPPEPLQDARACLISAFQSGEHKDRKEYSQVGEDGILESVHRCINREFGGYYVEFGTENGSECTTRYLRESKNWTGLLLDGGNSNPDINLHEELISYENIVSLFQKYKVPMTFDHLTVDLDLGSFWLTQAILAAGYRPRTLIVEINRNFDQPLEQSYTTLNLPSSRYDIRTPSGQLHGFCYFGASPRAITRLAQHFGYLPIAFDEIGVNIFLVHTSEVGGLKKPSRPSKLPGDTIDDDFNLEKAVEALGYLSSLGQVLHDACHLHSWLKVGPGVNFSSPEWMGELEVVVLSMNSYIKRVFREERLITGHGKGLEGKNKLGNRRTDDPL